MNGECASYTRAGARRGRFVTLVARLCGLLWPRGPAVGGQMRRVRLSPVGHVSGVRSPDARRCAAELPSRSRSGRADASTRSAGVHAKRTTTVERWMRNINYVSAAKLIGNLTRAPSLTAIYAARNTNVARGAGAEARRPAALWTQPRSTRRYRRPSPNRHLAQGCAATLHPSTRRSSAPARPARVHGSRCPATARTRAHCASHE